MNNTQLKHVMQINEFFEQYYSDEELAEWVSIVLNGFDYKNSVPPKRIGEGGGNGDIFNTPDNKILKVTKDRVEAANARDLIPNRNKLKYFAKYFSVKEVIFQDNADKIDRLGNIPLYAIVMEKLKVIDSESNDGKVLDIVLSNYLCIQEKKNLLLKKFANNGSDSYENFLKNNEKSDFAQRLNENENFDKNKMNLAMDFYDKLNLIMKEAKINNILIGDSNSGNFGYNSNNVLVMFDLGGMGNAMDKNYRETLKELQKISIPKLKTSKSQ